MEKQNTAPKFGTAFKGLLATDWAITRDGYRQMLAIAARINVEKSVDKGVATENGTRLEYTRSVTMRDGVAIIPVIGPIFRYANYFTYYCGGCTVQDLAKDLRMAIEHPNVFSILFEVNSPGGEVGGINALGQMIFDARKKIPMTAFVDVYGCSAAYWLASACGDIAADPTAQVGSIGVCTAYIDDSKNLEMQGFEEIDIISSQSPYKNMPPTTDEGRARVQARIDALAQIFVETVARNRGVSVKTVLKDFGKGDVLLGADAVEAKMIDRISSFEETLALLAEAHTPEMIRSRTAATFNSAENLDLMEASDKSDSAGEENSFNENIKTSEENMKPEEKVEKENSASQVPATEPAAASAAVEPAENTADLQSRLAAIEARNRELEGKLKAQTTATEQALANAKREKMIAGFTETAKAFVGDQATKVGLMTDLADKFGEDSPQLKTYIEDQKAVAEQQKSSAIFAEQGKSGAGETGSALEQITKLAAARAAEKGISTAEAEVQIAQENPELYARHQKEQGY